jgi:tetratricopeptide (TPR) repeat protein
MCATISTPSSYKDGVDRIEQLRKFIAAAPDEAFPRYALALELKGKGDSAAAAAELEELLRRRPDYLAAYLQLGMLLQLLGKVDAARVALSRGQEVARTQGNTHTLSELTQALESL